MTNANDLVIGTKDDLGAYRHPNMRMGKACARKPTGCANREYHRQHKLAAGEGPQRQRSTPSQPRALLRPILKVWRLRIARKGIKAPSRELCSYCSQRRSPERLGEDRHQ